MSRFIILSYKPTRAHRSKLAIRHTDIINIYEYKNGKINSKIQLLDPFTAKDIITLHVIETVEEILKKINEAEKILNG